MSASKWAPGNGTVGCSIGRTGQRQLADEEEMEARIKVLPLLVRVDGVMAPFRPEGGMPDGKTVWREVKVSE